MSTGPRDRASNRLARVAGEANFFMQPKYYVHHGLLYCRDSDGGLRSVVGTRSLGLAFSPPREATPEEVKRALDHLSVVYNNAIKELSAESNPFKVGDLIVADIPEPTKLFEVVEVLNSSEVVSTDRYLSIAETVFVGPYRHNVKHYRKAVVKDVEKLIATKVDSHAALFKEEAARWIKRLSSS